MIATTIAVIIAFVGNHHHHKENNIHKTYATCYSLQGKTASGHYVNRRTAAVNWLPFHTRIRIVGKQSGPRGIRKYIVRDTGPALSDGHFDLWSPDGCDKFGIRNIKWKIGWSKP